MLYVVGTNINTSCTSTKIIYKTIHRSFSAVRTRPRKTNETTLKSDFRVKYLLRKL